MKIYNAADYGLFPSETECAADKLEKFIAECGDDSEIVLPEGVWFLKRRIKVSGIKNLTIRGENAVIRIHFDNKVPESLDGAFAFSDCRNLTLKNFTFDTDVSPNISGRITKIDREARYFEVRFFDEFPLNGDERLEAFNTVDEEYTPDYCFVTYRDVEHTYLGSNTFRLYEDKIEELDLSKLHENQLINVRHLRYGAPLVTFENVEGGLIEDITITAAPGCVFVVSPRCSDFTFNRYVIRLPENTTRTMAANADGIHVAGVTGTFNMKDCYFENLGDDALNIHSKACMVTGIDKDKKVLSCHLVRPVTTKDPSFHKDGENNIVTLKKFPMGANWTRPGDVMYVYEQATLKKLGEIRVVKYEDTTMEYEIVYGTVDEGNVLANSAYYAATHVDNCTVKNTRARAFLFQTNNVLVENCHIYGMAFNAFLLSPDISFWYEVGPCTNVVIRNNTIEKCTCVVHRSNIAAIVFKCRHEEGIAESDPGVHNHVKIIDNTFRHIGDSAIFALAVDDLTISGNRFESCSEIPFDDELDYLKHDIALVNCSDVSIKDNYTSRTEKTLLYTKGVTNMRA